MPSQPTTAARSDGAWQTEHERNRQHYAYWKGVLILVTVVAVASYHLGLDVAPEVCSLLQQQQQQAPKAARNSASLTHSSAGHVHAAAPFPPCLAQLVQQATSPALGRLFIQLCQKDEPLKELLLLHTDDSSKSSSEKPLKVAWEPACFLQHMAKYGAAIPLRLLVRVRSRMHAGCGYSFTSVLITFHDTP